MPTPPEAVIRAALTAGFDAELRVAAILADAGWQVRQNVYYIDKDERKGRELDIYAYRNFKEMTGNPVCSCQVNFCVEVKKTSDPFIFYSSSRNMTEGTGGYGLFNWLQNVDASILSHKDIDRFRPEKLPTRIARSYSEFKKGDHIKSGILSAFKGAAHYTDRCDEQTTGTSRDACFFLPIMVVDGEIFECFYEPGASELTAESRDSISYRQNYETDGYGHLSKIVHVFTLDALERRLPSFQTWGEHMLETLVENRNKATGF